MQTLKINPDMMNQLRSQTANSDHWKYFDQLIEALPHSEEIDQTVGLILEDVEQQWFSLGWKYGAKPEQLLELGD